MKTEIILHIDFYTFSHNITSWACSYIISSQIYSFNGCIWSCPYCRMFELFLFFAFSYCCPAMDRISISLSHLVQISRLLMSHMHQENMKTFITYYIMRLSDPEWGRGKWLLLLLWLRIDWNVGSCVQARAHGFELPTPREGIPGLSYWLSQMWAKGNREGWGLNAFSCLTVESDGLIHQKIPKNALKIY